MNRYKNILIVSVIAVFLVLPPGCSEGETLRFDKPPDITAGNVDSAEPGDAIGVPFRRAVGGTGNIAYKTQTEGVNNAFTLDTFREGLQLRRGIASLRQGATYTVTIVVSDTAFPNVASVTQSFLVIDR